MNEPNECAASTTFVRSLGATAELHLGHLLWRTYVLHLVCMGRVALTLLQFAVANAFNLPARRSAWIVPRASALQLSSAGISASLEKARPTFWLPQLRLDLFRSRQRPNGWAISKLERSMLARCSPRSAHSSKCARSMMVIATAVAVQLEEALQELQTHASSHSTYRGWGDKRSTVAPWCRGSAPGTFTSALPERLQQRSAVIVADQAVEDAVSKVRAAAAAFGPAQAESVEAWLGEDRAWGDVSSIYSRRAMLFASCTISDGTKGDDKCVRLTNSLDELQTLLEQEASMEEAELESALKNTFGDACQMTRVRQAGQLRRSSHCLRLASNGVFAFDGEAVRTTGVALGVCVGMTAQEESIHERI